MKTRQERIEIVNRARARVKEFGTINAYARNAAGWKCDPTSDEAVCWCAVGALRKECHGGEPTVRETLGLNVSVGTSLMIALFQANDGRSYESTDAVFDRLIAAIPEFP